MIKISQNISGNRKKHLNLGVKKHLETHTPIPLSFAVLFLYLEWYFYTGVERHWLHGEMVLMRVELEKNLRENSWRDATVTCCYQAHTGGDERLVTEN